ncbi:MAG: LytR/AlgR family response regulator transcription factor [Lachnospiraceae bacterium]
MIQIAIAEDEMKFQNVLMDYLETYQTEMNQKLKYRLFADGKDLMDHYSDDWNLIFLDIKMKQMDGMETARLIREKNSEVTIVFITTMAKYAIEGYKVDAYDFLLKPLGYQQFHTKLTKMIQLINMRSVHKFLLLPFEDGKEKISTDQILYIEVKNHKLNYITMDKTYIQRGSLSKIEEELYECHFIRCSNSYLVNLKHVSGIEHDYVLVGADTIPISRSYKKEFIQRASEYLIGR